MIGFYSVQLYHLLGTYYNCTPRRKAPIINLFREIGKKDVEEVVNVLMDIIHFQLNQYKQEYFGLTVCTSMGSRR